MRVFAAVLIVSATAAQAESSRMAIFQQQLAVLDGRAAGQYEYSNRLLPKRDEGTVMPYLGSYSGPYLSMARQAAVRANVPEDLFLRLIERESYWDPQAVSPKGAQGLAQLMPDTAAALGVDPFDPQANLDAGARYLRQQFDTFGSWRLALAAYNAGPEAVRQAGGIPDYAETQAYVLAIWGS